MLFPTLEPAVRFFRKGEFALVMRNENPVGEHFVLRCESVRVGKKIFHKFFNANDELIGVWTRTGQFVRRTVR